MKTPKILVATAVLGLLASVASAQVPTQLNYQGRILSGDTNFNGVGIFKFALVRGAGSPTLWSNDGTSVNGSEPTDGVKLSVENGLYSLQLGDTSLAHMTAIPTITFAITSDVRLRVWFDDGVNGSQLLSPDQRVVSVGFSMMAANVENGAITASKLANGAVTAAKLAPGAVSDTTLPDTVSFGSTTDVGRIDVYKTTAGTPAISLIGNGSQISTYGSDGLEQIRLWGAGYGQILMHDNAGNDQTVDLAAEGRALTIIQPFPNPPIIIPNPGAELTLRSSTGQNRLLLKAADATGGYLHAYQNDGGIGVTIDGDESGAGSVLVRNAAGSTRVKLDGQSTGSGGEVSVMDSDGSESVELLANTSGGSVAVRNNAGSNRAYIGSSSGGYMNLYAIDGSITATVDGDSGGAGYMSVRNATSNTRVAIDGLSAHGSGEISVYGGTGQETIEILGSDQSGTGGQIVFRQANGTQTVEIDGEVGSGGGGYMQIRNGDGAAVITLDGDVAGSGRVTTEVLQITGGSDLSEQFDIKPIHDEIKPGMLVCIDPDEPGRLITSTKSYDRTVAGIVSGAGGVNTGMLMGQKGTAADGKHAVALTGRVYCWVDADQGAVRPGDLITTSSTAGHGMKVDNHLKAQGAIIGKAMSKLDKGKGLVLMLVSLQ